MSTTSLSRDPDELAELRAEVAALRGELRCHTASPAPRPRRRFPRRFLPLALVALLVVLTPLATFAANPFNDLTGGVHDPNIDLIYNAGITTGCVPNVSYCPTDNVTREQMASFLARTAGLGTNPPVVNAKTVGGYAPSSLITVARARSDTDIGASATYVDLVSVTINAPTAGYVMLTGATRALPNGGACPCEVDIRLTNGTANTQPMEGIIPSTTIGNARTSLSPTTTFAVAAGSNTFKLQGLRASGTTSVLTVSTLNALFTPFGSTTGGVAEESTDE